MRNKHKQKLLIWNKRKLRHKSSDSVTNELKMEYEEHQKRKVEAREDKDKDKQRDKENKIKLLCSNI